MSKNKTTQTENNVLSFLQSVPQEEMRIESLKLLELFKKSTKQEPRMWGPNIIGFGNHHYKYESGREGDMPIISFAPRKNAISLYLGTFDKKDVLLSKLGKFKAGKGCINISKLSDIKIEILSDLIIHSYNRKIIY